MPLPTDRVWKFLPGFLKRAEGVLSDITRSITDALNDLVTFLENLKALGLSQTIDPSLGPAEREKELDLIAASRGLSRYSWEDLSTFEARIHAFPQDVLNFGTLNGIRQEVERSGLTATLYETGNDPQRWILLSLVEQGGLQEDQISHIFTLGNEDPSVRGDRIYSGVDEIFSFTVTLSGTVPSKQEIRQIIKATKPAYTVAYVYWPGETYAEEVK